MASPIIPNLNDSSVREKKGGEPNFLWLAAYGTFKLSLRFFKYEPKSADPKKGPFDNNWIASCKLLEAAPSDAEIPYSPQPKDKNGKPLSGAKYNVANLYQAGKTVTLRFPIGRGSTGSDPGRDVRDMQVIADFVAALFGTSRENASFDGNSAFKALAEQVKFDDDRLCCNLQVTPNFTSKDIKDPVTQEVLRTVEQVYPRHRFTPAT